MTKAVAVIDDNTELQKTAERIIALKDSTDWDLPVARKKALTGKKLDEWLEAKEDQASVNMVERGLGYALKKRELGHGVFMAWIKETGRSPRAVQEAIQIAHMLTQLSDSNAGRAAHLPQRKLKVLASAPPALIDDLFDNDELNDEMSREEMRDIINLQKKNADLSTKLDTAVQKIQTLQDKAKNKSTHRFPAFVERVRHESTSQAYRIDLCVDDMHTLFNELMEHEGLLKGGDAEGERHSEIAYASLYHNLNGALSHAHTLLMHMREQLDKSITGPMTDNEMLFDEDEALSAAQNRELLLIEHSHEKLMREHQRKSKTKRSRKSK